MQTSDNTAIARAINCSSQTDGKAFIAEGNNHTTHWTQRSQAGSVGAHRSGYVAP